MPIRHWRTSRIRDISRSLLSIVCYSLYIREVFCQQVVTALANFCHAYGKVLPTRWQSLANSKAKTCQAVGNSLVELLGLPLAQNNVDDDRRTDNGRDGIQGNNTRFAGQDANQIAKQCHCTATQDSDRQ